MPGHLIQTTVDVDVLKKLDALAKTQGHKRASYLRHMVEMHVQALTPELLKITEKTNPLDAIRLYDEIDATGKTKKHLK